MRKRIGRLRRSPVLIIGGLVLSLSLSYGQQDDEPGRSIGKVSMQGDLIVMELNEGALGMANIFDLIGHTLLFTPDGSRYRVENRPLHWDSEFGPELTSV